ncbi:single-stranded DNA-binding protein [Utexia brackfieldae]|uniref:single-stranded DNA-binding protein n=1 Tax=Utexia brackfieldae TaxID=3074108 RepID=UPI00370D4798
MSINTLSASGNVGKDCELRYTNNNTPVAEFHLPVKQGYGEHQKTAWLKCVMWGKAAESFAPNIKKGDLLSVSGEFYVEEYEKDGVKRVTPCLRVNQIQPSKKLEQQQQANRLASPPPEPPTDFDDYPIPF